MASEDNNPERWGLTERLVEKFQAGGAPETIYLYYVRPIDTSGHPVVRGCRLDDVGPIPDIDEKIAELAQAAVRDEIDWKFKSLGQAIWKKYSYLVVMINDPAHVFKDATGFKIIGGKESFSAMQFNAFEVDDGEDNLIPVQVNYCINFLEKKGPSRWEDDPDSPDRYPLHLDPDPDYITSLSHDDTGQNMGP